MTKFFPIDNLQENTEQVFAYPKPMATSFVKSIQCYFWAVFNFKSYYFYNRFTGMKCSRAGEFYGINNDSLHLNGVILDDSDYLQDYVDWHWHENAYFSYLLTGAVLDGNKKNVFECVGGDLLFHNWQDAHYNRASKLFTRGFHVEVKPSWFASVDLPNTIMRGSNRIQDPQVKLHFTQLFKESKVKSDATQLSVDMHLTEIFSLLSRNEKVYTDKNPSWVKKVEAALQDGNTNYQLTELAQIACVHPVHLSRSFSKYFHCTIGDYTRQIKLLHSIVLMANENLSLTDIALECGFTDQSHFIRAFKYVHRTTPLQYRKLLLK